MSQHPVPTFQEIVFKLKQYWSDRGCIIQEPFDTEVGAGTMCPETFLRVLGPRRFLDSGLREIPWVRRRQYLLYHFCGNSSG